MDVFELDGRLRLQMAGAASIDADKVVLSVGSLPPVIPAGAGLEALGPERFVEDPWRSGAAGEIPVAGRTLLLGTGLTAIDVLLDLDGRGLDGQVFALSRRGLLPRAHDPEQRPVAASHMPTDRRLSYLAGRTRSRAREIGWRNAIDELRPITHQLWWRANPSTRMRFLRHLRPYWDVHRHRLAPEAMQRVQALEAQKQFRVQAGQLLGVEGNESGLDVRYRPRGTEEVRRLQVDRIVNCTGVQGDLLRSDEPLLCNLCDRGVIRPDPLRLGIDTDAACRTIDGAGRANERLYCIGPMTRGAFWEMTAVPDLRRQAWMVARQLANAHWTGGEGL
jgi:uncharacterized NAD(P)/FAD-binding protein YdhS